MIPLIFWGATGQAKVLREALSGKDVNLLALFDNRAIPSPFNDVPLLHAERGFLDWAQAYSGAQPVHACVAIGGIRGKERLERMLWLSDRGYPAMRVIHRRAFVAADATIGEGCQLLAMSSVCTGTKLGRAVIINTKASVDHECVVGDGVHIAPGATLAGETVVGDFAFIGAGAVVLPRVRIGAYAIIGAGAVVIRDVADYEMAVGNPARIIKKTHDPHR